MGGAEATLVRSFLSTPVGVHYLHEIEFIEREMDQWFHVSHHAMFSAQAALTR